MTILPQANLDLLVHVISQKQHLRPLGYSTRRQVILVLHSTENILVDDLGYLFITFHKK